MHFDIYKSCDPDQLLQELIDAGVPVLAVYQMGGFCVRVTTERWARESLVNSVVNAHIRGTYQPPSGVVSPHTHPQGEVTGLTAALAAKAATDDARLSDARTPLAHSHVQSDITGLVSALSGKVDTGDSRLSDARTPLAHSHAQSDVSGLSAALSGKQATSEKGQANGYASLGADGKVPSAQLPASQPGGEGIPAGVIVMWGGLLANIPTGWALCDGQNGTPDLRSKFIKGASAEPGATGGALTHSHASHSNLVHSGAAVGDHAYTPQGTNSGGAVSAHSGTAVAAHADHTHGAGTIAVANHADHTHNYTQVPNHVHVQTVNSATTGGLSGYTPDTSSNTGVASGYSTQNPTGGVATAVTLGANSTLSHSVSGNTGNPSTILSHAVTQPNDHVFTQPTFSGTQANLTHSVTQPNDHTISAHDTVNHEPPFYALAFIQKL